MQIYIESKDWADEGDVFLFSLISEEKLQKVKNLLDAYVRIGINLNTDLYWGTNTSFVFNTKDFYRIISNTRNITLEEITVLEKFNINGWDVLERIIHFLSYVILTWDDSNKTYITLLSKDDLKYIVPFYLDLFGENWTYKNIIKPNIKHD